VTLCGTRLADWYFQFGDIELHCTSLEDEWDALESKYSGQ
jgi:hypothetical protein